MCMNDLWGFLASGAIGISLYVFINLIVEHFKNERRT